MKTSPEELTGEGEKEIAEIEDILSQLEEEAEERERAQAAVGREDSAVTQLANKIILDAYARNASDIIASAPLNALETPVPREAWKRAAAEALPREPQQGGNSTWQR